MSRHLSLTMPMINLFIHLIKSNDLGDVKRILNEKLFKTFKILQVYLMEMLYYHALAIANV